VTDHAPDDFSDTDTYEVGIGMTLTPSAEQAKAARMRDILEKASGKAQMLGRGKQIAQGHDRGLPATVIAEQTGLTPAEVREVTKPYSELDASEQKQFQKMTLPKSSVFDLHSRVQELFDDIKDAMKFMDDPELKLGYFGELRQLFKLAKDVLQDVTFKKQQEEEREEETQLILDQLNQLDPKMASQLFAAIRTHRERKRVIKGGR
jgi:hypothetical protein